MFDCFQQFKNSFLSCGTLCLTCLNLPSFIRNLREMHPSSINLIIGVVKSFVITLVIPGNRNMESWNKLPSKLQEFYGLLVEHYVETLGLPLYATVSSYGANLSLTQWVDWFQQFNSSPYSCGAMYLTCFNLPRSIRNLRENMILLA